MFQRSILTDNDIQPLEDGILKVLETVGIFCQNEDILKALDAAGARVDYASERATFPREMVLEYVECFRKLDHYPDLSQPTYTPPGLPGIGTQIAQLYYDHAGRETRSSCAADMITLTELGDVLQDGGPVGHSLSRTDVHPLLEPLASGLLMAEHARVPAEPFAWRVDQTDYLIEMGEILGIKNWYTYGAICFAHPLRFDSDTAGRFYRRAAEGGAIGLTAMPVAGASTPVTLEGFLVVASAEHVATWIAGRAINPDVDLGGSVWAGTIDMKSGQVSYSAPDAMLYGCAQAEFMRRWCNMHLAIGGGEYSSAKAPGMYAVMEKAHKAMTIAAFSGQHPTIGGGMLDNGKILAPVQLILERDFSTGAGHLARKAEVTDETIAMDDIIDIGVGLDKNHLMTDRTCARFRDSVWLPDLIDRSGYEGTASDEKLLAAAHEKFEALLDQYEKPTGREDQLAEMRKVVDRARTDLLG